MRNVPARNRRGHSYNVLLRHCVDTDEDEERGDDPHDHDRDPDGAPAWLVVDRPVLGGPRGKCGDDHHIRDAADDEGQDGIGPAEDVRRESGDDEWAEKAQEGEKNHRRHCAASSGRAVCTNNFILYHNIY